MAAAATHPPDLVACRGHLVHVMLAGMTWHRRPKDDAWRRVTLASINALGQGLWMHCNGCGHGAVEPPLAFAERAHLAVETPLLMVAEALVCSRCGAMKAHAWPQGIAGRG